MDVETKITSSNQSTSGSTVNEALFARFKAEREEWTARIGDMSERLKDIYKVADLQTDVYSYRQIAVDYTHTLMTHLSKVNQIFRAKKVDRWEHYTRNYDLRMDKEPKELHILVDIAEVNERKELLQNHLDYFRETIRTIDSLTYGIKHRIQLEDYKRG
jgi:hypothetical protein